MIEMFVHSGRPLVRREWTKERMRVPCALRFSALVKSPDTNFELFLLLRKISLIGDNEFLVGGTVLGKRLVVGKEGPHKRPEYSADEHPG